MRCWISMTTLCIASLTLAGCSTPEKRGLAFSGATTAERVQLLVDETWVDAEGQRHVDQEIFDSVFGMIDEAEEFILIDLFLVNDFLFEPGPEMRPLSKELTERLLVKRKTHPNVPITFITDPLNTVYQSVEAPHFTAMQQAGIQVVWTNLDRLRDTNPIYSKPWRLFVRPWGTGPGEAYKNPIGEGRISRRSMYKLLNFKANHRKVVVTEKSLLVMSANPHDASSAHWNVALRVDGAGMELAWQAESAILRLSDAEPAHEPVFRRTTSPSENRLLLLTERKIKDHALELLAHAGAGTRIDLTMFYFSERDLKKAFIAAQQRGCKVRVILDPNKDAFGRIKNGIPNRQTAAKLVQAGIPLRWADTHGEQCHTKMLYVEHADLTASLLLGSCNYTRRNTDTLNAECDLAYRAPVGDPNMERARHLFDRWWTNADGRIYTTDYSTYEDPSVRRKIRAWLMEATGFSTF